MRVVRWPGAFLLFVVMAVVAGVLVAVAVTPGVALAGQGVSSAAEFFEDLPSYLDISTPQQVSTIYAKKGGQDVAIASFFAENRVIVKDSAIATTVKQAAIDTEDPRFATEGGIDVVGTLRGAASTALGKDVQGGSSITQQYVKNVLVQQCEQLGTQSKIDSCYQHVTEVSPQRKLQEMRYAIAVNKKYSKSQILTGYLNIVGLGGRVYGVEAGAEYYFGVTAAQLNLEQSATLVAILNNPANLRIDEPADTDNGSANGYALTKARRDYVLKRMYVHHDITKQQRDAAIAAPITPKITATTNGCAAAVQYDAGYFCDYVRNVVLHDSAFGTTEADRITTLDTKGLKIYTSLDLDLQATAQSALSTYVPSTMTYVHIGGSNVTIQPGTGRVLSMVQNTSFNQSDAAPPGSTSVNYSTDQAYGGSTGFQTGSTFKVFTLAEWLASGHTLNQYVNTTEHTYPTAEFTNTCENIAGAPWSVANAEAVPASMSVMLATAESINTAFAAMGKQLDLCQIAKLAEAMGIHKANGASGLFEGPSMILGVNELSPLTLASAYAGFANGGVFCTPVAIDKVTQANGKSIAPTPTTCTRGVSAQVAATVDYALQGVLQGSGTAASANPGDSTPKFAKTGTTDADVQNWLVTSTTKYTNATWIGNVKGAVGLANVPMLAGTTGYSAKFGVGRTMMTTLDQKYGGDALPTPDPTMVGSTSAKSTARSGSSSTTATIPAPSTGK
ncbi:MULTISPECIES: transglycosylase domain-containing protein [unclassified Curtobacterium]|uniref:transglycosylase domain-containing protein n=1 Tax=unclassified Curtobacterium TaxID=257496 RepID=UPI000DA95322|nr:MULTISPECIES: transglycosylase domain-containing protein [unclassified Curtobacterium]PZE25301.1 penicillin-binding protein [Curtobacterium sp. MCBD17_028]PZE71221.1 penicillin-binding protein [Curtobacterium sp. MCBD17_019]PZF57937.1 penicillin-binding protein [Curtobacterium sp. MCBD17_034]PZM33410.1 penicillin-binding protein [Curtobacterium sp. MCBD17_031]WIE53816.1 transglycosylase domain-containing protein [Curtobacterium sp. MCBD17_003]